MFEMHIYSHSVVVTARSELRKVLFLEPSVCGFFFVHEISREPLNGSVPNSHERRVWSLAPTSFKVKSKVKIIRDKKRYFSALSAACVGFMFGKTSLASSYFRVLAHGQFVTIAE